MLQRHSAKDVRLERSRLFSERRTVGKLGAGHVVESYDLSDRRSIILLLTGVELIACEVCLPATCEISGASSDQGTDSGDACLCCCFHIVVRTPLVFEPTEEAVALEPLPPIPFSSFESASIYHPPKA